MPKRLTIEEVRATLPQLQTREFVAEFERGEMDDDARTVPASLSSDADIDRGWFVERLVHKAKAVDLTRAEGGLVLLFNHDRNRPIGIIDNVRLSRGKLRGVLRFSPNHAEADRIWRDVRDGFLRHLSIGYQILEFDEERYKRDNVLEVTAWRVYEGSIVTIPADHSVGANRATSASPTAGDGTQSEIETMPKERKDGDPAEGDDTIVDLAAIQIARAQGVADGATQERKRVAEIEMIFAMPRYRDEEFEAIKSAAIGGGWSPAHTREQLLKMIGEGVSPIGGSGGYEQRDTPTRTFNDLRVESGETAGEKFQRGAELALAVRYNIEQDKEKIREARRAELVGLSFPELCREYLRRENADLTGLPNSIAVVRRAMTLRSQGSGSLPSITENVANMSMLMGFEEQEETWRLIARVNTTPDFRQFSRVGLSTFENLEIVEENGEYKLGQFGDRAEKGQLSKRGKRWNISMEALANDELGVLLQAGRRMGRAGQRAIGDAVYGVLTSNPTLNQDSTALFHADHNNIMGTAALPTVDSLDAMDVAMATQTDPDNADAHALNISLARVITPISMKRAVKILATAEKDPGAADGNSSVPNPFAGTFIPVADARLTGTTWYGSADPNVHDTIEVTFLNGQDEPVLLSRDGWTIDGIEFKVSMPVVAIPLGYQGLVRNPGS